MSKHPGYPKANNEFLGRGKQKVSKSAKQSLKQEMARFNKHLHDKGLV